MGNVEAFRRIQEGDRARPDQRNSRVGGIGRALEEPAVERLAGLVVHRPELGEDAVDRRPTARLAVDEDEVHETLHETSPEGELTHVLETAWTSAVNL